MKKVRCQAKVVGTLVTVAGTMLMTLYKGPRVEMVWTKHAPHHGQINNATYTTTYSDKDWFIGSILLIIATLAWASLFVLQVRLHKAKDNTKYIFTFSCILFSFHFIPISHKATENIITLWHNIFSISSFIYLYLLLTSINPIWEMFIIILRGVW